jgi:hypothetical protein
MRRARLVRRFLKLVLHAALIVVAAVISFVAVDMAGDPGTSPAMLVNGLMAGAIGLVLGLLVAWMRGVPWRLVPVLMRVSYRRLQQEFWWIITGAGALAVLAFY